MSRLRTIADELWTGARRTDHLSILSTMVPLEEVAPGVAFHGGFANVIAVTTSDGVVLIDTGSPMTAPVVHQQVRAWTDAPAHTAIYTHGHVDHAMGTAPFEAERPLRVVAHEAVAARFDRYRATAGWNTAINTRQFRIPGLKWPTEYRYPDVTYRDRLDLDVGDTRLELHHHRGETDDHTIVWIPRARALCTGDLFIWAAPNCGNPQKVQRYVVEWARALDAMRGLGAELLLPGHGPPIFGADRVDQALRDTAALLHTIHDQVVAAMNDGKSLDEVIAAVAVPAELLERPYLRPVYDDPAFIVRNVWRRYGGWWDGNPARLLPPRDRALAAEVVALAGGIAPLVARARAAAERGDLALACQLAEWAHQAAPDDAGALAARKDVYRQRADGETSLMARSIFTAASEGR
ncbi:MAG: MBL fold metallo-hydrolase [Kofleriaceae bacterium]|nr:MBL fold metallo-hydrolase [Kofleriaceae bacterium]